METSTAVQLPKVAIRFCVQCKWNLRAAYYAQELLSTFGTTLGEISLIPVTGGIFTINLYTATSTSPEFQAEVVDTLIWDRKRDGGFPETKELKNRVRNVVDPDRDMGHVDRALKKKKEEEAEAGVPGDSTGAGDGAAKVKSGEDAKTTSTMTTTTMKAYDQLASHAGHKTASGPPKDCEECMAAAQEGEAVNKQI